MRVREGRGVRRRSCGSCTCPSLPSCCHEAGSAALELGAVEVEVLGLTVSDGEQSAVVAGLAVLAVVLELLSEPGEFASDPVHFVIAPAG